MKKSIIYLLFLFAICAFSPNIVFAQVYFPQMEVSENPLDFGNVFVGTTKTLTINIQNKFGSNQTPLLISWNPIIQPFSISPVGVSTLYVGGGKIFTITFKPTAAISYNQTNTLSNNASRIFIVSPGGTIMNGNNQYIIHFIGKGVNMVPRQISEKK